MGLFRRRLTRARFAAEALRIVRAHPDVVRAELDENEFAIRYQLRDTGSAVFLLQNSYAELAGLPAAQRRERVANLLFAIGQMSDLPDWPTVRPMLRPVLRGATFGLRGNPCVSRPALPYLAEFVVVDQPTSMAYVTANRLAEWGVEPGEAFAAARRNLSALMAALGAHTVPGPLGPRGLARLTGNADAYFASWLLADGFLSDLRSRLGGRPVVFVPDTTTLMITVDDPEALAAVQTMVDEQYDVAPRSLSPMAYTVDDSGAVVPYRAATPGPLAERLHRAEIRLACDEYGIQRQALQAAYGRDGVDVHVSDLMAIDRPDGSRLSVAVWPLGGHALLPEADYIGLVDGDGTPTTVPWPIVRSEMGLIPEPGLAPPRYRVDSVPAAAVLERLRAEAVNL